MGAPKIFLPKSVLENLYIKKNLSPFKIGKQLGCSFKTIRNRLKDYEIPFKDPAFARTIYPKKDFQGKSTEKAYMIGFRIGDLNVYRRSPRSYTIVVRCHTTQAEQVEVIKSLFGEFGRVTISHNNRGHFHINCLLNNSFSFLLTKDVSSWEWVRKSNDKTALAFIAGYTDAEGNIILNQGRARFKIDSYDADILKWTSQWLFQKGIHNKLKIIYKKGEKVPNQNPFPCDLWRLNINGMNELQIFLTKVRPFLRHEIRIAQTEMALNNISRRKHGQY